MKGSADLLKFPGVTAGRSVGEAMAGMMATAKQPEKKMAPICLPRLRLVIDLPGFPLRSEANAGGKRRDKIARKMAQKTILRDALPALLTFALPTQVVLLRLGGRPMDDDNLRRAFKAVRDVIAQWLNVDDGDAAAVRFKCKQRPSYKSGIRILIGG